MSEPIIDSILFILLIFGLLGGFFGIIYLIHRGTVSFGRPPGRRMSDDEWKNLDQD